jgi:hypothetical protein
VNQEKKKMKFGFLILKKHFPLTPRKRRRRTAAEKLMFIRAEEFNTPTACGETWPTDTKKIHHHGE